MWPVDLRIARMDDNGRISWNYFDNSTSGTTDIGLKYFGYEWLSCWDLDAAS